MKITVGPNAVSCVLLTHICIGFEIVILNVRHVTDVFFKDESLNILRDHVTFQDEEQNGVFFDSTQRFLCREAVFNIGNLQHISGLWGYTVVLKYSTDTRFCILQQDLDL
jgi:hypothetical protein